jgi:DNA (cytosine-5)-methyltransferase 1
MKYLSLFSGIGGFELGIQQAYENITSQGKQQESSEVSGSTISGSVKINQSNKSSFRGNITCVGYSEIDKYAIQIYEKHFKHKNWGDITKIRTEEIPDFDLLVGGVPCQSWSIAGKRKGFEDERGNMWFQYSKILRVKQPKFFVAENVKGLLSHEGGKSMERICEELCGCGYAIDFEVLNSKNYGVPQNRERVFIVGVRLDLLDECQVF